jgi:hypothetical protein
MTLGRLLLTRRWVALTLLAAVTVVAFAWLGAWQFGRSYRAPDGYSDEPLAVPVAALAPVGTPLPAASVGRQATAAGRYLASRQQLVPGHVLDGSPVEWVVTPLLLADGSVVNVVRGWVTGPEAGLEAPPAGAVAVTGRLALAPPAAGASAGVTARPGLLVRTAQSPPDPLSLQPVPSRPVTSSGGSKQFHLQNAVYTSQWWIFAVLVVGYWWRLLRDERAASAVPA